MARHLSSGARLEIFETLDSTSAEVKRRAAAGENGPLWIQALRQTAGYGRRGSAWSQSDGDLAASLLFTVSSSTDRGGEIAQLSFVAAVALADALETIAPHTDFLLKWPNDVYVGDAKLSGILMELLAHNGNAQLSFGVGVNILSKPEIGDQPTARLFDCVEPAPTAEAMLTAIDFAFAERRRQWVAHGFDPIRSAWMARGYGIGAKARITGGGADVEGEIVGLDGRGALVLRTSGGETAVSAGSLRLI